MELLSEVGALRLETDVFSLKKRERFLTVAGRHDLLIAIL